MKLCFAVVGLLVSTSAFAVQTITLEDGRQVQLNDDFTWEYKVTPLEKDTEDAVNSQIASAPLIPVAHKHVGTKLSLNSPKPIMQLSDSGVDILLGAPSYKNGELIIPTSLTNQSRQSIIKVSVELTLSDLSGQKITQQTVEVWQSIKRMAETYLRPQQSAQGQVIHLTAKQADQYYLSAKVVDVTTR